jgi:hypothetical protein
VSKIEAAPVAAPPAVIAASLPIRPAAPRRPVFPASQIPTLAEKTPEELKALLGEPDFTRRDPPAEIWQYRSATCVLDLFLYPEGSALKVMHASTRDRVLDAAPGQGCTPFGDDRSASG